MWAIAKFHMNIKEACDYPRDWGTQRPKNDFYNGEIWMKYPQGVPTFCFISILP